MPGPYPGLTPDSRMGGSITGPGQGSQPKSSSGSLGNDYYFGSSGSSWPIEGGGTGQPTKPPSYMDVRVPAGTMPTVSNPNIGFDATIPRSAYGTAGLGGAQSIVDGMYGPQQQILQDQLARQRSQLGMIGVEADYQSANAQRDYSLALQGLGLDRQALGVESGLNKTQLANLGKLRGILTKQYGLQGEVLANQMAGFAISEKDMKDQAGRKQWDLRSDLTQRGAFNTVANERGTGRINRDLATGLAGLNVDRTGASLSYRNNVLGLDEKGIGYDNQQAGLQARLSGIGIDFSRLGLSEQQLANSLQDGLHQIGLNGQLSLNSLLDAIGGTNVQQSQVASTMVQYLLSLGNYTPQQLALLYPALGIKTGGGSNPVGGGGANGMPL